MLCGHRLWCYSSMDIGDSRRFLVIHCLLCNWHMTTVPLQPVLQFLSVSVLHGSLWLHWLPEHGFFLAQIFLEVVQRHDLGLIKHIMWLCCKFITWVSKRKYFEKWLIFGEVMQWTSMFYHKCQVNSIQHSHKALVQYANCKVFTLRQ